MNKKLSEKIAEKNFRKGVHCVNGGSVVLPLSIREVGMVNMLARGLTVSEIGCITDRAVKAVSQQKRAAMRRLGVEGDSQMFERARLNGL